MNKQSFVLYTTYFAILKDLSDEDLGIIFRAILAYVNSEPYDLPPHLKVAFGFIKNQLDIDSKKYDQYLEKQKANGLKGGRPKTQKTHGFFEKPNKTQQNLNENENENENENVSLKEKEEEKEISLSENPIKPKNPDLMFNQDVNKVFEIYGEECKDLIPVYFERKNLDLRQAIRVFLNQIDRDFAYFTELCRKANSLRAIVDRKIDLKMLLNNHERIYSGFYTQSNSPPNGAPTIDEILAKCMKEGENE